MDTNTTKIEISDALAGAIYATLEYNDVHTDFDFVAEAGPDYGSVDGYKIENIGGYVTKCDTGNETTYVYTETEPTSTECREWLAPDDYDAVTTGNILGIDAVDEATEDDDAPYHVLISQDFFGPTSVCSLATDDHGNTAEFDTIEAAQDWIDEQEEGTYVLSNNESGRPDYKIVTE